MSFFGDLEKVAKDIAKDAKPIVQEIDHDLHGVAGGPLGPLNLIAVPAEFRHLVLRGAIAVLEDIIDYLNAHEDTTGS